MINDQQTRQTAHVDRKVFVEFNSISNPTRLRLDEGRYRTSLRVLACKLCTTLTILFFTQIIGVDYVYFNQTNSLDRRERTLTITAFNESFSSRVGVTEHCYYSVGAFNYFLKNKPKRKSRKFLRDKVALSCGASIFRFFSLQTLQLL